MTYGWAGTARELVAADPRATLHRLRESHSEHYADRAGDSQSTAWSDELAWLSAALHAIQQSGDWNVVLEYELPLEGGRRPDAVVLAGDHVLVLEFKSGLDRNMADIDQVAAYARDLAEYHSSTRGRLVAPILVYTSRGGENASFEGVRVVGPDFLPKALAESAGSGPQIDLSSWLDGTYAPLPSLVTAARRIFNHESLPAIRRAESAGIPSLLEWLHQLVRRAESQEERHLVLLTGVPGSGKTLVGLQFVYDSSRGEEPEATFFSGNDPLVTVLQDAVQSKVFVRRWHEFDLEYGVRRLSLPVEHVLVFDEAQRAWDQARMSTKKGVARSEPAIVLDVTAQLDRWGLALGLVGEGQEIYLGEEAGLAQWADALRSSPVPFRVHVSPRLASTFRDLDPVLDARLDLTISLRTHRAEAAHDWVAAVLEGDLTRAAAVAAELGPLAYDLYVTDNLLRAKQYLVSRYASEDQKRFGLVASSKARNLREIGIDNEFQAMQRLKVGRWFNAASSDPLSCCQLSQTTTEFQCQGLELDMPLLCWGDDLGWRDGMWVSLRRTLAAHDSHQLRLNSYRVLMTRGRDGLVIYVPPNLPDEQNESVMTALKEAGMRSL